MRLLRIYILKDFLSSFLFALLSLSLVMTIGNIMKLSTLITKGINLFDAIKIFLLFVPYLLSFTLPLSFLLAVLLTMGKLLGDNEIVAINVAGISSCKILKIFLLLGVIFSLVLLLINDRVIPNLHYQYRTLKQVYSKNISALIEPGVFLDQFDNYILYASDKEGNTLKNVFIYEVSQEGGESRVTFAKRAEFVSENNLVKMKLEDGFRDEAGKEKDKPLYRLNFKIFFMNIPLKDSEKQATVRKKPSDMTLKELRIQIKELEKKGVSPVELIGEFHKRISFSLSILTFILFGFAISLIVNHREKSINFGIAIMIAGIYYLLFILGQTLLEYHFIIPSLGMWLPNILIGLIGVALLYKNVHFR